MVALWFYIMLALDVLVDILVDLLLSQMGEGCCRVDQSKE